MELSKEQKEFLKMIIELNNNYSKEQKEFLKFTVDSSLSIEGLVQKITIILIS